MTTLVYLIILGPILLIIFLVFAIISERVFKDKIVLVNFLLTLIPKEKWNEEATVHMLKAIYKI